jgi:hypothetical protein
LGIGDGGGEAASGVGVCAREGSIRRAAMAAPPKPSMRA